MSINHISIVVQTDNLWIDLVFFCWLRRDLWVLARWPGLLTLISVPIASTLTAIYKPAKVFSNEHYCWMFQKLHLQQKKHSNRHKIQHISAVSQVQVDISGALDWRFDVIPSRGYNGRTASALTNATRSDIGRCSQWAQLTNLLSLRRASVQLCHYSSESGV